MHGVSTTVSVKKVEEDSRILLEWDPEAPTEVERVFVGVHYPYDVVAGLALGATAAPLLALALASPSIFLVKRLRGHRLVSPLLSAKRLSKAQRGRF